MTNPRFPIYIVSKGRWESRLTSKALDELSVPYRIVVEPQERDAYASVIDPAKILVLPFSNLGQGSIPARNWIWDHAAAQGAEWHWCMDDNLRYFFRLNYNSKVYAGDGTIFYAAEDFVLRYENVGQAGFQYGMFAPRKEKIPPFYLNTRIYSCILNRTGLPHRWRGRYNEDTDLSLRILKDGWCTILFNAFLAEKQGTMLMKGGNTDELYQGDGRLRMAQELVEQHPDVVRISKKWGRYQHLVDYRPFKANLLQRKPDWNYSGVDEFGMVFQSRQSEDEPWQVGHPASPMAQWYEDVLNPVGRTDEVARTATPVKRKPSGSGRREVWS